MSTRSRNLAEFNELAGECCADYTYLFRDGKWYVGSWNSKRMRLLSKELAAIEKEMA